jgi:hypothetical protein
MTALMQRLLARSGARLATGAAVTAVVIGCGGCADGADDSIAVRVGPAAVTSATVKRWMSAMAGGRLPPDPSRRQQLREQALAFLISSQWLLGEAAEQRIELSGREVRRQLEQKRRASFPGGAAELHEFLKATGQDDSNITFEAKAELASAKIQQMLASRQPAITQEQVASYYARHRQRYLIPERRMLYVSTLKSTAYAQALRRDIATGKKRFADVSKHELIELPPVAYSTSGGEDAVLDRAVHFARPRVLIGPVRVHGIDYCMFEVKRITPARQQTLTQVQSSIMHQLTAEQQRRTLAAFIRAWRPRWTARTDCSPGYVVQKCRQYNGPRTPEDPVAFN